LWTFLEGFLAVDFQQRLREDLRIVLVNPLFPGNVGAAARAMKNMGLRKLILVDPPAFDMERARWMAAGGKDILANARIVGTVAEALDDCALAVGCTARVRRWNWPIVEPRALAEKAFAAQGPTAILFGREDSGLDNEALSHCQLLLRIPTDGDPSLNLGQAVLLTCWSVFESALAQGWEPEEESRQGKRSGGPKAGKKRPPPLDRGPASLALQQQVVQEALRLLNSTPYMSSRGDEQVQVQLGMLIQRLAPSAVETDILRGMIRKTLWALNNPEKR
jgi:TrmH family RNA methyltransferase